jgi:hypothetical protein
MRANVLQRLLQRLPRQGIHQIEIEIAELRRRSSATARCVSSAGVNAAQRLQRPRRKGLRAQRHAIDAGITITGKAAALDGAGIGLQGHFRVIGECDSLPQLAQQPAEILRLKQAGRAAAEEYRVDPAARKRGNSRSKSRINASMYEASGCADFN